LRAGLMDPKASGRVVSEGPASLVYDGENGMGMVVGTKAMHLCLDKAEKSGVAFTTVRNSNHFGTAGYYAAMALQRDMIGFSITNSPSVMAPWGGKKGFLGTNPLAIAVPAGEERPFILDMATSVIARGAVILAAKRGDTIPPTWAMNADGEPTTDAKEAMNGAVLPLGGHKGFGLSMAIDIMAGILGGGPFGPHIGELYGNSTTQQKVGHFFGAFKISQFRSVKEFKADMDAMIREVKAQPLGKGFQEIMVAGDPEARVEANRKANGIPLSDAVVGDLTKLGASLELSFDKLVG
ncbi:MAG TPA: Ldh family oxidoreductase, partial [Chloroflexota bacterium]|nr:Ldh family oxidoreductase [Chloroflexota bacterium]